MKYLLFFLISLLFTACMPKEPEVKNYPVWFESTTKDSSTYYYASAEAVNKNEAVANALNMIASKISISISSTYKSNTITSANFYNKEIENSIKNTIKNIDFNNYTIVNEKKFNNNYLVFLKVNRLELAKELESKIKNSLNVASQKTDIKYKNSILKLREYNAVLKTFGALKTDIYTLASIDKSKNIQKYLTEINNIQKKIKVFKATITFKIKGKNSKYKKALSELITQKGYKLSSRYPSIIININIHKQQLTVIENKIIKGIINISAFDAANHSLLGEKRMILGAKSKSSFQRADEFMLIAFQERLKNNQILYKLLGI